MTNQTRRIKKYLSDVFINPGKLLALTFSSVGIIITGCVIFGIAELTHCLAHIKGAHDKYAAGKKDFRWFAAKVTIKTCRLLASLLGAAALATCSILGSTLLAVAMTPVFVYAFMASSIFSTLHKMRGLYDHCTKHTKSSAEYNNKKNALITRAGLGLAGTGLSIALMLKVSLIMALIANPVTFYIGTGIFVGMALWKARQAYLEYKNPKHGTREIVKQPELIPALDSIELCVVKTVNKAPVLQYKTTNGLLEHGMFRVRIQPISIDIKPSLILRA